MPRRLVKTHLWVYLWEHFQRQLDHEGSDLMNGLISWWVLWEVVKCRRWGLVRGSRSLALLFNCILRGCTVSCPVSFLYSLSLLPGHSDVNSLALPHPPFHDGLSPLKLRAKINPSSLKLTQNTVIYMICYCPKCHYTVHNYIHIV
jgi:hypothetical protein